MTPSELKARFDTWFSQEYERLRDHLSLSVRFDEDAFHDAYLSVREHFKQSLADCPNFATLFLEAYKKISKQHISERISEIYPDDLFFDTLADRPTEAAETPSKTESRGSLANAIKQHVKRNFNLNYVLIWESRMITGLSWRDINQVSGVSIQRAKSCIELINHDIRKHFAVA